MVAFAVPNYPLLVETYALDFETSYSKKKRDIGTLGTSKYLAHAETDIYLVSIYGRRPDGTILEYSGPLETAPWADIDGKHWVSHNASFDAQVFMVATSRGQIPTGIGPLEWDDTAGLAVFLGSGRSLAAACEMLLGITISKDVRDQMNGQQWATMTPQFKQECIQYALDDARHCFDLWDQWHHEWPAEEIALSRHTLLMTIRGISVDLAYVESNLNTLRQALWACEQRIPWCGELDAKGKEYKIGSKVALAKACIAAGIPTPASTANDSPVYEAWTNLYAGQAPFVEAMKDHRSISRTIDVFEKFRDRTMPDGVMPYGLKYGGAHTLRWSGESGLNLHNLTKEPLVFDDLFKKLEYKEKVVYPHSVDLRGALYPAPGKKFIIADLKQIEARVTLWYAEDWAQLELLRGGMDVYEAHARATMGYTDPMQLKDWVKLPGRTAVEADLRQIAKARVLGLGFGMGWERLILYAATKIGIVLTPQQAKKIVNDYRRANPGVVKLWHKLQRAMEQHAVSPDKAQPFRIELPSWRSLEYYDVNTANGLQARDELGGRMNYWFGGKLAENCLAGDTEVLTEVRGWVPLSSVTVADRVWDGVEWVAHEGLLSRGDQDTVDFGGVRLTPDHKVLVGGAMIPAGQTTHEEAVNA